MEKGQGKRTDTLPGDNDYLRRGDVKRLLENVVCLREELPAQIDLIPAADVRPVVLCKDCIHSHILGKGTSDPVRECRIHRYIYGENRWVNEDDFCAWGRQKENKDGDGDV